METAHASEVTSTSNRPSVQQMCTLVTPRVHARSKVKGYLMNFGLWT